MKVSQYLQEDVEIDPGLLKTEKCTKRQKEIKKRRRSILPDFAKRLAEAGLGDVMQNYVKKG